MVQLHAVHAGLAVTRPTNDIDMILHIETGAASFAEVRDRLESLRYALVKPQGDGPVHRFLRNDQSAEQVDVMVADHLAPSRVPRVSRHQVFQVPGGTSALRKTVNCHVSIEDEQIMLSVPSALGALVLKGAAFIEDARDRARHLDDAAVLACTLTTPVQDRKHMEGSDGKRIRALWAELQDDQHVAWSLVGGNSRRGHAALKVLAAGT